MHRRKKIFLFLESPEFLLWDLILDNAESSLSEPLPFAYLNIDSSFLDVERPETFIVEAAKQLSIQIAEKEELSIFK